MFDIIIDTCIDTIKILPFLFLTFLSVFKIIFYKKG